MEKCSALRAPFHLLLITALWHLHRQPARETREKDLICNSANWLRTMARETQISYLSLISPWLFPDHRVAVTPKIAGGHILISLVSYLCSALLAVRQMVIYCDVSSTTNPLTPLARSHSPFHYIVHTISSIETIFFLNLWTDVVISLGFFPCSALWANVGSSVASHSPGIPPTHTVQRFSSQCCGLHSLRHTGLAMPP